MKNLKFVRNDHKIIFDMSYLVQENFQSKLEFLKSVMNTFGEKS